MGSTALSTGELARYQRHLSLRGFGPGAQLRLKNSRVLVIGAGGLGCPALLYLAAAGVGRITIMDPDRVDVSNLQRQILYTQDDAGTFKADAAARRLAALNPLVTVLPRCERFTPENARECVQDADLVLDGSDNFATRYLANDACVLAGRPLVYGAVHQFEGQVSVFNYKGGPTYRCLFPEPPDASAVPNCAEAGVLGVLPGLIGTAQAAEAIKVLTGIGEPLSGRLLIWDALTMHSRILRFSARETNHRVNTLPPLNAAPACCAKSNPAVQNEISAAELRTLIAQHADLQLIDVREDYERLADGSIEPSVHCPLGLLRKGHGPDGLTPDKPTVVYCAGGARSLQALALLRTHHSFTHIRSLRDGLKAWSKISPH